MAKATGGELADLWANNDVETWRETRDRYGAVITGQAVSRLEELDRWYRLELPRLVAARPEPLVTHDELVKVTEWKMKRGVWRQRNLILVKANDPEQVEQTSRAALARIPDPLAPIVALTKLGGVGPATASAVAAAVAPATYPFFDEIVANQLPELGAVDFTTRYYARYADALRERACALGGDWTPVEVERALYAHAGGKAALAR